MRHPALALVAILTSAGAAAAPMTVDTHQDVPLFLYDKLFDFVSKSTWPTDLDKLKRGGVNLDFFALWTPGNEDPAAMNSRAREMQRLALCTIRSVPGSIAVADDARQARSIARDGKIAVMFGLEGGHALMDSLDELRRFRSMGVRYVTLTHDVSTNWADAELGEVKWHGLNDLGERMVREMNRIGIIPDLTHASEETALDTIRVSREPVLLSHHGVRALVDNPLNASDRVLDTLKANGGVISIILFDPQVNRNLTPAIMAEARQVQRDKYQGDPMKLWDAVFDVMKSRNLPPATIADVADQIDYVVKRIGIDHVGIGTDFLGGAKVTGFEDISQLPALRTELARRGYGRADIDKIMGENVMRILEHADRKRVKMPAEPAPTC